MIRKVADWLRCLFTPVVQPSAAEYVIAFRERQRRELLELHNAYHAEDINEPTIRQSRR